jgi:hypothetical protein
MSMMPSQSFASFRGLESGFRTPRRLFLKKVLRGPKTAFQACKTHEGIGDVMDNIVTKF